MLPFGAVNAYHDTRFAGRIAIEPELTNRHLPRSCAIPNIGDDESLTCDTAAAIASATDD